MERITGTPAWAPYSVLCGGPHTVSSQLEGLFISMYSIAVGHKRHAAKGSQQHEDQCRARIAEFAHCKLAGLEQIPLQLRPLITELHALFWSLPGGARQQLMRVYQANVTVVQFTQAVRRAVFTADSTPIMACSSS